MLRKNLNMDMHMLRVNSIHLKTLYKIDFLAPTPDLSNRMVHAH